jgi:hypothetical protein
MVGTPSRLPALNRRSRISYRTLMPPSLVADHPGVPGHEGVGPTRAYPLMSRTRAVLSTSDTVVASTHGDAEREGSALKHSSA